MDNEDVKCEKEVQLFSNNVKYKISEDEIDEIILILKKYTAYYGELYLGDIKKGDKSTYSSLRKDLRKYIDKYEVVNLLSYLYKLKVLQIYTFEQVKEKPTIIRDNVDVYHYSDEYFYNNVKEIEKCDDAIIFVTPEIQNQFYNVIERKATKIGGFDSRISDLDNSIKNFHKEIIAIVSIILSIVPIMLIDVNIIKDRFTINTILIVNGSMIFAISSIFLIVSATIMDYKGKRLLFVIIPLLLSICAIVAAFLVPTKCLYII